MKRLALLLVFTFALVFAPTGAFAKDKHKKHRDRDCDDRRYSSYRSDYGRSYYGRSYDRGYYGRSYDRSCDRVSSYNRPVYYRQSYYAPNYYSGYRTSSRHYCPPQRSRGGLSFVIGF